VSEEKYLTIGICVLYLFLLKNNEKIGYCMCSVYKLKYVISLNPKFIIIHFKNMCSLAAFSCPEFKIT